MQKKFVSESGIVVWIVVWIVVSTSKNESGFKFFVKIHKVFKDNIWWMIKCDLLKLLFSWNFIMKNVCSLVYHLSALKKRIMWYKNSRMTNFFPLTCSSVTIWLSFYQLLNDISNHIILILPLKTINTLRFLSGMCSSIFL